MASVARQPFAPVDGPRLQSLRSIKNQHNTLLAPKPKRKVAEELDLDDIESVRPFVFTKRAKSSLTSSPQKAAPKPSTAYHKLAHKPSTPSSLSSCTPAPSTRVVLEPTSPAARLSSLFKPTTKKTPAPPIRAVLKPKSPTARLLSFSKLAAKQAPPPPPPGRAILKPRSPTAGLRASLAKFFGRQVPVPPVSSAPPVSSEPALSSLSTPAGRSPPRRKGPARFSPYGRVAQPSASLGAKNTTRFGLDAALKGTIPRLRQAARTKRKSSSSLSPSLSSSSLSSSSSLGGQGSWFFDIHEDTAEQETTNLLLHSTCVLDISSDEECEKKDMMEKGRNKENIPPTNDITRQTPGTRDKTADEMDLVKERRALGDLNAEDFYASGCDSRSVFVVPADEEEEDEEDEVDEENDDEAEEEEEKGQPEEFGLWESGSAHGDDDDEEEEL